MQALDVSFWLKRLQYCQQSQKTTLCYLELELFAEEGGHWRYPRGYTMKIVMTI